VFDQHFLSVDADEFLAAMGQEPSSAMKLIRSSAMKLVRRWRFHYQPRADTHCKKLFQPLRKIAAARIREIILILRRRYAVDFVTTDTVLSGYHLASVRIGRVAGRMTPRSGINLRAVQRLRRSILSSRKQRTAAGMINGDRNCARTHGLDAERNHREGRGAASDGSRSRWVIKDFRNQSRRSDRRS
jgi:hypothetical protein